MLRTSTLVAATAAVATILTPSAADAGAAADLAPLLGSGGAGEYIVVLKRDHPPDTVDEIADRTGAVLGHRYTTVVDGFSATLTRAGLAAMRRHPAVAYVERDRAVRVGTVAGAGSPLARQTPTSGSQSPVPSWGLDRIDQRDGWLDDTYHWLSTGRGVRAYIIDTGVRASHPDLSGRVTGGYDAVDHDGDPDDCHGHGTALAGVIGGESHGVAKDVTIEPVRVLDCGGSGSYAGVIEGIDWVAQNAVKPATAILALGGGPNTTLDAAVENLLASGVSVSVAAGSSDTSACYFSPARVPGAITVSASDGDRRAASANWGPCVDLFAPGVHITTIWYTGGVRTLHGTALAAAHVTGAAALYLEFHPEATAAQVHDAIVSNATPCIDNPGPDTPPLLLYSLLV